MRKAVADRILDNVRGDYDTIAAAFSTTREKLTWPDTVRFRDRVRAGDRVLDLGCGNGRGYQLFDGIAIDYEGIDISPALIDKAREIRGGQLVSFKVGSALDLPYEDESFDVVLAVAVLHHVPSRAYRLQALREAYRVLRPGGTLLMTNWAKFMPPDLSLHLATVGRILRGNGEDLGDLRVLWKAGGTRIMRYVHAFTARGIARLCRQVGFAIEKNGYIAEGGPVRFWKARNIVTICRRPEPLTEELVSRGFMG